MTRHRTLILTTLLATVFAASLGFAPAAIANHPAEFFLDPIEFNIFAPSDGVGYQFLPGSSCAHGEPCVFVPRYGFIEYTFRPNVRADFYDYIAGGNSGTQCTYHLEVDVWGIPMSLPASGGCPFDSYPRWRARLVAPTWEYGRVGESVLHIQCQDQPCTYELDSLRIEPGYLALDITSMDYDPWMDLDPLTTPSDLSLQSCVTVKAAGSYHYPIDYFRIAWGDGDETFDDIQLRFPEREAERTYCHAYPPSLIAYQLCVTVHDKLDRLDRECIDVEAPIETT